MKRTIKDIKEIGNSLREMRQRRGLSLRDAGKIAGVKYTAIHRLEQRRNLTIDNLRLLAKFYGVTSDTLIGWIKTGRIA
jgi:transcriptional regulator with XRE-family HTH domain